MFSPCSRSQSLLGPLWAVLGLFAVVVDNVAPGFLVESLDHAVKLLAECQRVNPTDADMAQLMQKQELHVFLAQLDCLQAYTDSIQRPETIQGRIFPENPVAFP